MNIAIVGVGNCAWSLLQSIEAARLGILSFTSLIAPRTLEDIAGLRTVLGFDVNLAKTGNDISVAASQAPNCTTSYIDLPPLNAPVIAGPLLDGLCPALEACIEVDPESRSCDQEQVVKALQERKVETLIMYLPVGSQKAAELYAKAALDAGCNLINCTPAVLANSNEFAMAFKEAGLVLLGDDMRSHVGSTTVHQVLLELFKERGLKVKNTYQLNIGGNCDFLNMRDGDRSAAKRHTKAAALSDLLDIDKSMLGIGPSDYVPSLKDRKVGYINIVTEGFLGMEIRLEVKLEVEDSPNAAPIGLDALLSVKARSSGVEKIDLSYVCQRLFKDPQKLVS
jgi:myo-inositol-1-phosphate synthase